MQYLEALIPAARLRAQAQFNGGKNYENYHQGEGMDDHTRYISRGRHTRR
jgi:hypothetical protein